MNIKVIAAVSLTVYLLASGWLRSHLSYLPATIMAMASPYNVFLSFARRSCLTDQSIR